ncbi:MAG: signal peptidase II [Rickettsiales bacterium]|jgi:signal peptidase II|nr:signal peptidase II [Rickettsiales bacterium]
MIKKDLKSKMINTKKVSNKKFAIWNIFYKDFWSVRNILIAVVCSALAIDIMTKQFIIYLGYGDFFRLAFDETFKHSGIIFGRITNFFNLVLVYNKGISFSMLTSDAAAMRWILSAVAMLIVIFILQTIADEKKLSHKIALSFVIAGALGNIFDRLRFGAVVDFLDFHLYGYHWPAFNFADIYISCGVGIFVILKLIEWKNTRRNLK